MKLVNWGTAAAVVAAGGAVARRLLGGDGQWPPRSVAPARASRWHVVTINRPIDQVAPGGGIPEPLAQLGDAVEVQLRPAPGGRGTELAVRLRHGESAGVAGGAARISGTDPRRAVRAALRQAKQVAETGEVLSPDAPPTARETLLNSPLEYATRHGREEGRL
ncbi:hypothetical protein SAMN05444365_103532 [Micromonospora pattaloongensis]|uniref:Uncharacterized protein n=1 Tax=Micromonospora pattaloongensis TaxID=405436 RepID=A0A1H3MW01_9ACTN|nr:hypothetical protein [Micromonospora pattaloongensis]SDY80385.1 hypothetical protein SAMN05444365_103532 [Micromonospora pattaloongensis]